MLPAAQELEKKGEICQPHTGAPSLPPAATAEGVSDGPHFPPAATGRAIQAGLQGAKHVGMKSTTAAMEVKFRGLTWIWPQICLLPEAGAKPCLHGHTSSHSG